LLHTPIVPLTFESEILDHLGLVAGIHDEMDIGERIDFSIAQDLDR
jgi:hypothetical protein